MINNNEDDTEDQNLVLEKGPPKVEGEEGHENRWHKLNKQVPAKDALASVHKSFVAYDSEEGIEVVWNEIELGGADIDMTLDYLKDRFNRFKQLKHYNIVRFYDFWIIGVRIVFITEAMTSGSLKQYLRRNKRMEELTKPRVWKRWCRQILSALTYMHHNKLCHGNIRCENIFLQHNGLLKLGATYRRKEKVKYLAPELHSGEPTAEDILQLQEVMTEAADIFSFGMVMLEIATGDTPFHDTASAKEFFEKLAEKQLPASIENHSVIQTNPLLKDFVMSCLSPNPDDRPTAAELVDHHLLQDIPQLRVMAAHYVLRNGILFQDRDISKECATLLEEVKLGVFGNLAFVKFVETRRAEHISVKETSPESDGAVKLLLEIRFPASKICSRVVREVAFQYNPGQDSIESVVGEMVEQGVLCKLDYDAMVNRLVRKLESSISRSMSEQAAGIED